MVITVHFLNTNYELKSYSLGVLTLESRSLGHKAMDNNEILNEAFEKYGLSYNLFFLFPTDTTSVMPATANIMGAIWFECLDPKFRSSLFSERELNLSKQFLISNFTSGIWRIEESIEVAQLSELSTSESSPIMVGD